MIDFHEIIGASEFKFDPILHKILWDTIYFESFGELERRTIGKDSKKLHGLGKKNPRQIGVALVILPTMG